MTTNILENYTNAERAKFMKEAQIKNKRIEKHDNKLYALNNNESVKNGEVVIDNDRPRRLRKSSFESMYFNTSLGWISRFVHMKNGKVWDFLKDIKPSLKVGDEIVTYTLIDEDYNITYDYENDIISGLKKNIVTVTDEFLEECRLQISKDFWGE